MSRTVKEWIGRDDDEAIPARVKRRIRTRCGGKCSNCGFVRLRTAFDHVVALCNGGANRESNIQLLCDICHGEKTKRDVAEKSISHRKSVKHFGYRAPRRKIQSPGFPEAEPQHTATRPIVKFRGF